MASLRPGAARRQPRICCQCRGGNKISTNSKYLCLCFCFTLAPLAMKIHPSNCTGSCTSYFLVLCLQLLTVLLHISPTFLFPFLLSTVYFQVLFTLIFTWGAVFSWGSSCSPLYAWPHFYAFWGSQASPMLGAVCQGPA